MYSVRKAFADFEEWVEEKLYATMLFKDQPTHSRPKHETRKFQ